MNKDFIIIIIIIRSRKYDWRGQKTLKLNIDIKE